MSFSDDDVAKLKACGYLIKMDSTFSLGRVDILALLARLEAAEVIAEDHASIYPNDKAVIEWLKSKEAGK